MGSTRVCKAGTYENLLDEELRPRDFGLKHAEVSELQGGDADENAGILTAILDGSDTGPKHDMVLLNAAAGLACAGLVDTIGAGVETARQIIASGEALERLRALQAAAA